MEVYGYPVVATVKKIDGYCRVGHKVGDQVVFDHTEIKGKVCNGILATIFPKIYAFQHGAEFPWDKNRNIITVPCGDCENPVVFEFKRDREHPWQTSCHAKKFR